MKKIFFLTTFMARILAAQAQIVSSDMGDEFKEISKFSSRQTGFEGIQTYSSGIINGSQFYSTTWSTGSVTTRANETFGKNFTFLFDKVRQELFMKGKESPDILLADNNQISAFVLNTDKAHYFVPASDFDSTIRNKFYEVLAKNDKGYTLLKFIKTKFVRGDERDIEKQRLGEIYDAFVDETSYYLSYNDEAPEEIVLKEKSIRKVMTHNTVALEYFFQRHKNDTVDEALVTELVQSLNN